MSARFWGGPETAQKSESPLSLAWSANVAGNMHPTQASRSCGPRVAKSCTVELKRICSRPIVGSLAVSLAPPTVTARLPYVSRTFSVWL